MPPRPLVAPSLQSIIIVASDLEKVEGPDSVMRFRERIGGRTVHVDSLVNRSRRRSGFSG